MILLLLVDKFSKKAHFIKCSNATYALHVDNLIFFWVFCDFMGILGLLIPLGMSVQEFLLDDSLQETQSGPSLYHNLSSADSWANGDG